MICYTEHLIIAWLNQAEYHAMQIYQSEWIA